MLFPSISRSSATAYFFLFILLSGGLSAPCSAHMTKNAAGQLVPCPDEAAGRPCTSDHWTIDLRMPGSSVEGACTGSSEADVERSAHYYTDDHSWEKISPAYCDTGSRQITEPPRSLAKRMLLDNMLLQTDDAKDRIQDAIKTYLTATGEEHLFEAAGGSLKEYAGALKDALQKVARLKHMLNDLHGAVTQDMLDKISQSEDDLNKSVSKMESAFNALPVDSRVALGEPRPRAPVQTQQVATNPPALTVTAPPPPAAAATPAGKAAPDRTLDKDGAEAMAQLNAALGPDYKEDYNQYWTYHCEVQAEKLVETSSSPPGREEFYRYTYLATNIDLNSIKINTQPTHSEGGPTVWFGIDFKGTHATLERGSDPNDARKNAREIDSSEGWSIRFPKGMSASDAQKIGEAFIVWVRAAQKKGQ